MKLCIAIAFIYLGMVTGFKFNVKGNYMRHDCIYLSCIRFYIFLDLCNNNIITVTNNIYISTSSI